MSEHPDCVDCEMSSGGLLDGDDPCCASCMMKRSVGRGYGDKIPVPILNQMVQEALTMVDVHTNHTPLRQYVDYLHELKRHGPEISPEEFKDGKALHTIELQIEMVTHLIEFREVFERLSTHVKGPRIQLITSKPPAIIPPTQPQ